MVGLGLTRLEPLRSFAAGSVTSTGTAELGGPATGPFSIDSLRADHLGVYGHTRDTSPFLDELAKRSTLFRDANATASWTKPSVPSFLTGMYSCQHGVYEGSASLRRGAVTDTVPDEALLIEVTPPECSSWNFQLDNHWMESLDYRYYRVTINKHTAVYESDGSLRLIVAHADPGHANWIETAGHHQGTMCFRWIRADVQPQPQCRVAKLSELS